MPAPDNGTRSSPPSVVAGPASGGQTLCQVTGLTPGDMHVVDCIYYTSGTNTAAEDDNAQVTNGNPLNTHTIMGSHATTGQSGTAQRYWLPASAAGTITIQNINAASTIAAIYHTQVKATPTGYRDLE